MLKSFTNIFTTAPSPFALQGYPGFPYSDWLALQNHYAELDKWYSGEALNETIQDKTGKLIEKFPLKLNPIRGTTEKHASVLFGQTLESIRDAGVPVTFVPQDPNNAESNKVIVDAITNAFMGSGGGALFIENGMRSQYLGGCVWGSAYRYEDEDYPIQISNPLPNEFLAYPDGINLWELREVWFVREISWVDAKAYGYPVPDFVMNAELPSDPESSGYKYYYIEHWTKKEYKISVNEQTILMDGVKLEGVNPFGIVPFVYIPHLRGKKFIGDGIITENVKGLIKEMNLRNADIGDAVSDDSHSILAVRGIRGALKAAKLPDGRTAVDLGSATGMGAGETQPDLIAVQTKSASDPQLKFIEHLDSLYRVEVKHPAVADGQDEGSQRSSLTLTTRMWPLQAHADLERINWTVGLLKLSRIILKMCALKKAYGVTEAHTKVPLMIKWATMLPRDRVELVNEIAIRKKNKLGSRKHMISLFGDVDNIEEEIKLIDEDGDKEAEQAMKAKPSVSGAGPNQEDKSTGDQSPEAQNFLKEEN